MNDWSRLAVDLNQTQKLGAEKNELHEYKYAPDKRRRGHVLSGSVSLTKPLRREEPRGQLRLSLTTTYQEWPVNHGRSPDLARPSDILCSILLFIHLQSRRVSSRNSSSLPKWSDGKRL